MSAVLDPHIASVKPSPGGDLPAPPEPDLTGPDMPAPPLPGEDREDARRDETVKESFPASDPPPQNPGSG